MIRDTGIFNTSKGKIQISLLKEAVSPERVQIIEKNFINIYKIGGLIEMSTRNSAPSQGSQIKTASALETSPSGCKTKRTDARNYSSQTNVEIVASHLRKLTNHIVWKSK